MISSRLSWLLAVALSVGAASMQPAKAQRTFDPERFGRLWPNTDFSRHSVPFSEILVTGVARDGIPPIDDPVIQPLAEAVALFQDTEPVISVNVGGAARAYPLGVLMRQHKATRHTG